MSKMFWCNECDRMTRGEVREDGAMVRFIIQRVGISSKIVIDVRVTEPLVYLQKGTMLSPSSWARGQARIPRTERGCPTMSAFVDTSPRTFRISRTPRIEKFVQPKFERPVRTESDLMRDMRVE